MKRFATYIEYLLMTRHYVFVPGIGGWMLHEIPAKVVCDTAEGENSCVAPRFRLVPPTQEIRFNRFMSCDDGMLVNAYMEAEGLSYDEASALIRHEVGVILGYLKQDGSYKLGSMGTLHFDEECHLSFTPLTSSLASLNHFGFEEEDFVTLPVVDATETNDAVREKEQEDTIIIPIKKTWLKRVAVIALVLCCFFANFTPNSVRVAEQYASLLDHDILVGKRKPNVDITHPWEANISNDEEETLVGDISDIEQFVAACGATDSVRLLSTEMLPTQKSSEVVLAEEKHSIALPVQNIWQHTKGTGLEATTKSDLVETPNGRVYYIIVASCSSQAEADRKLSRLARSGYEHIGVLERDGRYRLYINVFGMKNDAEHYLVGLREVATFQDAWLLPIRLDALSHISKNQNNEQLSMELSHLTTRTDQDQGGFSS